MSVEASIASLEGLEKKLSVTVSAEKFTDEYNKKFKSISSNLRLPGFRKGKIPVGLIQSRFGQSIITEVTQELISSSLQSALLLCDEIRHKCARPVAKRLALGAVRLGHDPARAAGLLERSVSCKAVGPPLDLTACAQRALGLLADGSQCG